MSQRFKVWIHLVWIVPLGFYLKAYAGPGAWWVNDYLAAVFYELFWILVFYGLFISPRAVVAVPVAVFVATCLLELLQMSDAGWLRSARSHFLGRTLLGTTFDPWDFPVYLVSCALGCLVLFGFRRADNDPSRLGAPLPRSDDRPSRAPKPS